MSKVVYKVLPAQTDLNIIIRLIERDRLKCTHVPRSVKEIQAG